MVYSTGRSKAVVPVLVLLFAALWFILRGDLFYVLPCVILFLCFSSPFSIVITSLGEEKANLSAFRTFVRFAFVWLCLCSLPLGVWEGLQHVIVALPALFSLPKYAYSNILKILQPKKENFQIKNSDTFHIPAQNIDCGYSLEPPRRGVSYEYTQSMFLTKIRKIMYTPVNPSFTI